MSQGYTIIWCGVMACMLKWPPELYEWEPCTPGRFSKAEQVCLVEARLMYTPWSSRLGAMQWVNSITIHSDMCITSSATETPMRNLKNNSALGEDGSSGGDRMKLGGESKICLETHKPMAIISTRNTITFGTYNIVMIMFEAGKAAQVAAEMRNYNLTVFGISATRWTGCGQWRFVTGESLLHSGHEEDNAPHSQGVGLMLSKTVQKARTGWKAHKPRTIKTIFQTKKRKMNMDVIQCYGPANDSNEDVKEEFYSRLSSIIQDWHGQQKLWEILGQHGLGEVNNNGENLQIYLLWETWLLEGVSSSTKGYTRQFGYHLTCQQRTR